MPKKPAPSPMLTAALAYAKRGYAVFPLQGKMPLKGTRGFKDATTDPTIITRCWTDHPTANVGLATGKVSRLVVLDVDGPEGETALTEFGPIAATLIARTGKGRHLYFTYPNGAAIGRRIGFRPKLDICGDGGYVVAPPSIHPVTKKPYHWVEAQASVAELPTPLVTALRNGARAERTTSKPGAPERWMKGSRNKHLTSLAGTLRRKGESEEVALAACLAANTVNCDPPLAESEVEKIVRGVYQRYPNTEGNAVAELNKQYALVLVGGRAGVLRMEPFEQRREIQALGPDAFRLWLANERLPDWTDAQERLHKGPLLSELWLKHAARRQYEGIVFDPSSNAPPTMLNLWRGFTVVPDSKPHPEHRCARFLRHILDNVAIGDRDTYSWIIGWFAQLFQQPTTKLGTSPAFRGPEGSGKTIIGLTVGYLLGQHWLLVDDPRYVVGQFNGHLASLLLLQADEAFWAADKRAEARLKNLITGYEHLIEFKGKEPFRVRNYIRLLVTSNENWVVPARFGGRRFAVFEVGKHKHFQDHKYFDAIQGELSNGGYEALLAYLLHFNWQATHPERIPPTAALAEQKEYGLTHEVSFLLTHVHDGKLVWDRGTRMREGEPIRLVSGDRDGAGLIVKEHLHSAYLDYMNKRKLAYAVPSHVLSRVINTFLREHECKELERDQGGAELKRDKGRGPKRERHEFPPLRDVRAAFARALGTVPEWAQPESSTESGWWPCVEAGELYEEGM